MMRARFRQGARIAGTLEHHDVVRIYEYGEDDRIAFVVMEFVDGETLKTRLDRGGRLPPEQSVELMRATLLALDYCHRRGIIHRDVKPANLMLPKAGGVKLTDFGIAHIDDSELTMADAVMGTPAYMSPEQFEGSQDVDARTDIWACGVVLYELLTGRPPFVGDWRAVRAQVMDHVPEPPSRRAAGIPAALDKAVLRALDAIVSQAAAMHPRSEVQSFASTKLSCRIAELVRTAAADQPAGAAVRLAAMDGRVRLHAGERIRLQVQMPDFGGALWLDYINSQGEIGHLERVDGLPVRHAAGEEVRFGQQHDGWVDANVGQPYGADIVLALVASAPLFASPRPDDEPDGAAYVDQLAAAVAALRQRGGRVSADAIVLHTSP